MRHRESVNAADIELAINAYCAADPDIIDRLGDIRICCNRKVVESGLNVYRQPDISCYASPSVGFVEIMNSILAKLNKKLDVFRVGHKCFVKVSKQESRYAGQSGKTACSRRVSRSKKQSEVIQHTVAAGKQRKCGSSD
jgi:hypothetical protein